MKYNAHIYLHGLSLWSLQDVDQLFCKQKLLNRLLITHDPRLRKHCILSDSLTPPRGRLTVTGVKYKEYDFHSLHCVYRNCVLTFSHILHWKYIWEPCGDRVIRSRSVLLLYGFKGRNWQQYFNCKGLNCIFKRIGTLTVSSSQKTMHLW